MNRHFLLAAVTASMAGLLAAPALGGGPRIGKIFDCYTYSTTGLSYVQALEFKSRSDYLLAPFRKGNRLSGRTAAGHYHLHGQQIVWTSGPYAKQHYSGRFRAQTSKARATVDILDRAGRYTGITCYQH